MSGSGRTALVGPALSLAGLVAVVVATIQIYRTWTPALVAAAPTPTPTATVRAQTSSATPVVVDSTTTVPGTLVYVRDGDLWVQSGTVVSRITFSQDGSAVSGPTWSSDGRWIYFVETRLGSGRWYDPNNGNQITDYTLTYPVLCRIHPDGSGKEEILSGAVQQGPLRTFYWIRQPAVSPDGATVAVISDGPTLPGVADNLLHLLSVSTRRLGPALELPQNSPLGLAEPVYSPDGGLIAYVMEGRSGKFGAPSIWVYDVRSRTAHRVASGFRGPSWSPDGKHLAATRVDRDRLDVVVLDAATGRQVAQVTSDGASWAPVWSPAGNALVYMHLRSGNVDLRMTWIEGSGTNMSFRLEADLTKYSGLDGGSRAAWYISGASRPGPSPEPSAEG